MLKVLITGADGQVGRALVRTMPGNTPIRMIGTSHKELDITQTEGVEQYFHDNNRTFDVVINCAAYTDVAKCESVPNTAFQVNAHGPENLARWCSFFGKRLIHISTDYVFDGKSSKPYMPDDRPAPLQVYGMSKLAGEKNIEGAMIPSMWTVIRTSWVYDSLSTCFPNKILDVMTQNDGQKDIEVVSDEVSVPTHALSLSNFIWSIASNPNAHGLRHFTDHGVASRYDVAMACAEFGVKFGLLSHIPNIQPCRLADFGNVTGVQRPQYSVLGSEVKYEQSCNWRGSLYFCLQEKAVMLGKLKRDDIS